jgi:hypothetical protein
LNLFSFVYFTKLRLRDSILEVPIGQLAVSNCSLRISFLDNTPSQRRSWG